MTSRAPRQSAEEWYQIIVEFHQSGLSAEEFCLHRGYASSTFNRWRLRYSKQHNRSAAQPATARPSFVEALPSDSGSVTITLDESVQIDCPLSLGVDQIALLAKAVATDERI